MFGHDAFILDGHVIARKLYHARALVAMPCVERQLQYFYGFEVEFVFFAHISPFKSRSDRRRLAQGLLPPLSRVPESFIRLCCRERSQRQVTPSVAYLYESQRHALSRVSQKPKRSFCLRDSGAVAPSAAPLRDALPLRQRRIRIGLAAL